MASVECVMDEGKILEMLEAVPDLVQYKNQKGETILHELAFCRNLDLLTKIVGHLVTASAMADDHPVLSRLRGLCRDSNILANVAGHFVTSRMVTQLPTLSRHLMEGDNYGCTPLHISIYQRHMNVSRYLTEVGPEAAYRVNNEGESPLYVAIKEGHDKLVNHVLQVMPEVSMSEDTRKSQLATNKSSLPHAAIRFRKLDMLKIILEMIPSFIDSLDEKGWKPLSYAAFEGYFNEVQYVLNKFPESVKKADNDGSLPIHKAVIRGHVDIVKEFISIHPKTLYSIDKKRRNILHFAVKCRKLDILYYLRDEVKGVEELYNSRDNDGKTFAEYAPA